MRSKTSGSQEDLSGVSSWAKEKLMEQKRLIKQNEDEIEELQKKNKVQQVCVFNFPVPKAFKYYFPKSNFKR